MISAVRTPRLPRSGEQEEAEASACQQPAARGALEECRCPFSPPQDSERRYRAQEWCTRAARSAARCRAVARARLCLAMIAKSAQWRIMSRLLPYTQQRGARGCALIERGAAAAARGVCVCALMRKKKKSERLSRATVRARRRCPRRGVQVARSRPHRLSRNPPSVSEC